MLKRVAHEPVRTEDERDAYPGLHLKAAALLMAMLRDRPFDRGNGRAALLATTVFLNLNGQDLDATNEDLVALVAVAHDGDLTLLQVAAAMERVSVRLRLPES
jgi:death-on-curing protein